MGVTINNLTVVIAGDVDLQKLVDILKQAQEQDEHEPHVMEPQPPKKGNTKVDQDERREIFHERSKRSDEKGIVKKLATEHKISVPTVYKIIKKCGTKKRLLEQTDDY